MNLLYIYKKKPVVFEIINFSTSVLCHLILFFSLNSLPNMISQPATWKQVHTVKKKAGQQRWSQGIEIINMVSPSEIKVIESKVKLPKGKSNPIYRKVKLLKGKRSFNQKIKLLKKSESELKELVSKNDKIKTNAKDAIKRKVVLRMPTDRGARSITEKSPLRSPAKEKPGQLSKKAGNSEGPKNKLAQKAPPTPPSEARLKKIVEKIAKKSAPEPVKKVALAKEIDLKKLPKPKLDIKELAKRIEKIKQLKKIELAKKIITKEALEKTDTEKPKVEAEKKKIIEKLETEKIEPEIVKQEVAPVKKIEPVKEMVKTIQSEVTQKDNKISKPVLSRPGKTSPKKMSLAKKEIITGDKINEVLPLTPDLDQKVEKVDVEDNLKIGSKQGTFNKEIKSMDGTGPILKFAPKGDKKLAKMLRTTAELDKLKFEDKKDITASNVSKVPTKAARSIIKDSPLKRRMKFEPIVKSEPKRMKIAGLTEEDKKAEDEKKDEDEDKKETKEEEKEEKIGEKDELQKILEELAARKLIDEKEDKAEKKYETTMMVQDDLDVTDIFEKINKEAKIIGKKNEIAAGDKGEAIKTVKLKRMFDRNPMSVTKRTPLTRVSRGGAVRKVIKETASDEDIKKIEKFIKETQKAAAEEEIGMSTAQFAPIFRKIDIEKLLFKEDEAVGVPDGGAAAIDMSELEELLEQGEFLSESQPQKEMQSKKIGPSSDKYKEKEAFSAVDGKIGKTTIEGKEMSQFGLKDKQMGDIEKQFKQISTFAKAKRITLGKGKFPKIANVQHNATHTLGKGDELVVTLRGDPGEIASFDIGLYMTEIAMNEVSPGVYRGIYRVIEGDNIIDATVMGYLINRENIQSSMPAAKTVSIDTSPGVTIATPPRDSTVDKAVQTITGIVDDPEVRSLVLSLNGNMKNVPVENGFFNTDVELVKGKNIIEIMAVNSKGDIGRDKMEITYATYKAGPKVVITFPSDGDIVNVADSPVVEIQGTVSDFEITKAKLTANDLTMDIGVSEGDFVQSVVLFSEENSYVVQVINNEGIIGMSDPVTVKATGIGHYDAIISLSWNGPKADLDLVTKSATNKFISHKAPSIKQNPNAIEGGKLELDDKGGFGPEVITLRQVSAGLYSVHVHYYESNGDKNVDATVSITLSDPQNPSKTNSKIFGPKNLKVEEEWNVTFIGLPEMGFYDVE